MEEIAESGNDRLMPGVAARMLGVTTKTLSGMSQLHPIVLESGHRRYLRSEIEALIPASSDVTSAPSGGAAPSVRGVA